MRVFIAIELPEHVRATIFHKFENLRDLGFGRANFVGKNNLHLTLKFIGEVSEARAKEIVDKLSEIEFSKFSAETGEIGFFPNEEYVRVMWVELASKGDGIFKLQELIENKLNEIKIKKDEREFQSHLTVARIKTIKNKKVFFDKIKSLSVKKMKFDVDSFSLIKSDLTRQGPLYRIIKRFKLK